MSKSNALNERPQGEIKFAADRMLGRLTKWLRVLGCDVIYGTHLSGYGLIRAARAEDRLILTRDHRLKQKQPPPFIFIQSNQYRDQLRQVLRECHVELTAKLFTRCLACNSLLQSRPKETVKDLVPAYILVTQEKFSWCSKCRRIFWPATHQQKMVEELGRITAP